MVEGTLALSIPGLFLTCVQYFVLIKLGRNFEADFGSCYLQLRWIELRLQRWGRAAGLTAEIKEEDFLKEFEQNHNQEEVDLLYDTLEEIELQLSRARQDSQSILQRNRNPTELELIDEVEQMQICEPKVALAHRFVAKVKSTYEKQVRRGTKIATQSKWALYKKTQFEALVKTLGDHVTVLESTIPKEERKLAAAEAEEMDQETFAALTPIVGVSDPLLDKAMKDEGPRKGFAWSDIVTEDDAVAHYGHIYNGAPQSEGDTSYTKMRTGGNSRVHAGNTYNLNAPSTQGADARK